MQEVVNSERATPCTYRIAEGDALRQPVLDAAFVFALYVMIYAALGPTRAVVAAPL